MLRGIFKIKQDIGRWGGFVRAVDLIKEMERLYGICVSKCYSCPHKPNCEACRIGGQKVVLEALIKYGKN